MVWIELGDKDLGFEFQDLLNVENSLKMKGVGMKMFLLYISYDGLKLQIWSVSTFTNSKNYL